MHLTILAEVDNGAEEVEEPLVALEGLKQVDEVHRGQLLVVLGGYLHTHLTGEEKGGGVANVQCTGTAKVSIKMGAIITYNYI